MGSDLRAAGLNPILSVFQSTLPAWGATISGGLLYAWIKFQSTLPAWGATRLGGLITARIMISIHAPRMGSDLTKFFRAIRTKYFNPRSPHGERPAVGFRFDSFYEISIHAPRMGSDDAVVAIFCF